MSLIESARRHPNIVKAVLVGVGVTGVGVDLANSYTYHHRVNEAASEYRQTHHAEHPKADELAAAREDIEQFEDVVCPGSDCTSEDDLKRYKSGAAGDNPLIQPGQITRLFDAVTVFHQEEQFQRTARGVASNDENGFLPGGYTAMFLVASLSAAALLEANRGGMKPPAEELPQAA